MFRRIVKRDLTDRRTDEQTDELIWGGLGNLRFLQVYENHHIRIHFQKYLTRNPRQFTFFKEDFTKSVGPGQFSAEYLKEILRTDSQTDSQTDLQDGRINLGWAG